MLARVLLLAVVAFAFGPRVARAATLGPDPALIAVHAEGRDTEWLANELTRSAPAGAILAEPGTLDALLAQDGRHRSLHLEDASKRDALVTDVRAAAAVVGIDVSVLAQLERTKTRRTARILVVTTADPAQVVAREVTLGRARDPAADASAVHAAMAPVLAAIVAPTTARPTPVAAPPAPHAASADRPAEAAPRAASADRPAEAAPVRVGIDQALVVVSGETGALTRSFDYVDKLTPQLRSYSLAAAPFAALSAEVYPFANARGPIDVGLTGAYGRSLGVQSSASGGPAVGTTWSQLDLGARARWRIQGGAVVAARAGYGATSFSFSDAGTLADEIPDVSYRFVRAGADGRVPFGRFAVVGSLDYLGVLSAGAVADRFPHASVFGIAAQLGASFTIMRGLEARAGARYTRFIYALSPEPGDRYVAGGAADNLGYATLGLAYFR